jgi:hypothetical protein
MFTIGQKVRIKDLRYNVRLFSPTIKYLMRYGIHEYDYQTIYSNYNPLTIKDIVDKYYLIFEECNNQYEKKWMFNFEPVCNLPKNIKIL